MKKLDKVNLHTLAYPLFKVSQEEYQLLRELLKRYDKEIKFVKASVGICHALGDIAYTRKGFKVSVVQSVHEKFSLRARGGYIETELGVYLTSNQLNQRLELRRIWLRKLINYNHKWKRGHLHEKV